MGIDADKILQISIHAIGDSANFHPNLPSYHVEPGVDRRFRIEHAQHIRSSMILAEWPNWAFCIRATLSCHDDGVWAEKRIGDRIRYSYPFKSSLTVM